MAFLGSALLGGMSLTSAEKAFRPWWDNIEDHIVYTIVILGIIVAPTSLVMSTTLDCSFCTKTHCDPNINTEEDPGLNIYFVRRYCALEGPLSPIILYFPYVLLIIATVLVMMDRPFVMILFKSFNMDELFKLLVVDDPYSKNFDKNREVRELKHVMTAGGSNYFTSYLIRTLVSLVVSAIPVVIFAINWNEFESGVLFCHVHQLYWYECSGHPVRFYGIVMIVVLVLLGLYFLLNVYNLAWLFLPGFGKLRRIMAAYKKTTANNAWEGDLYTFYYNNSDVQLLLNLLASSSGLAEPLRSLSLIDKDFNSACLPELVSCHGADNGNLMVNIKIKDGSLLSHLNTMSGVRISFLVEAEGNTASFTPTSERCLEASLPNEDTSSKSSSLTIRTLVNGKITSSDNFKVPVIVEEK